MLTGALKSLFAVAEAYPELKANENFMMLQEELSGTESKIAYCAPVLQRLGHELQHRHPEVPGQPVRRNVRLHARDYFEIERPRSARRLQVSF